ncbi:VWA domain-containing protein [Tenacibaculum sp. SZ-18]|nr:VWA domain-containing protein [Tenacibaculum sp. SZ-18]AUC17085.1 VWA domain-containing protein [Tenacibaculum sp. SZ-18]
MKREILLFFLCCLSILQAQQKKVTGTVSDKHFPIPGVSVYIKGTNIGTSTNMEGKYSIKASANDVLIFSLIGMKTKQEKVGKRTVINVLLEESDATLDEVVISTASNLRSRKNKVYASIASQMAMGNTMSYDSDQKQIRDKKTSPLFIVDGIPVKANSQVILNKLDPKEIKAVEVLKGNNAIELYGPKGKNGCVIITTKKGNFQIEENDSYAKITENPFKNVVASPLSTFSIDVDKASYSNIRRMINNGEVVKEDAVKIEEMINYFDYNYPQPQGKHPFSITTEFIKTPWNTETKLLKIGLQGKTYENKDLPPSNLTFLIDVSGSMGEPNKLPLLKKAFKLLVNQLREEDRVSIVVYAGAAGVVLEPTSGRNKEKIFTALNNLNSGGSTAGGEGIELAYKLAEKNFKKRGNNRVILATDGDFNVGRSSNKAMEELIEQKRKSGVFLSVLGFAYGNYKDDKLEILADKGNGNHAYIDTMQEAQKVFGKEFGGTLYTIAKDVKIQVEFNPNKAKAYRLIGYENRLLNDEDFIDDTKDAGELGSGHSVTALYEVIPVGVDSKYLNKIHDLKYTNNKDNSYQDELLTVKFRYKKPDGKKSIEMERVVKDKTVKPTSDMNFASSVALFGMYLRKSQFMNDANLEDVIKLAAKGKGQDEYGYRSEFIRLVKTYSDFK